MSSKDWQSLAGIASALGLVPILIVIIGRLWTTTYFDHVGLPSSGLEFSIYDYAFRSREVLISLVLGVIGFSAAWLYRDWLGKRGLRLALLELLVVVALLVWAFVGVEVLSQKLRTSTGVLGLSSGLPLAAMLWFTADIWQGPGDKKRWSPRAKKLLSALVKRIRLLVGQQTSPQAVALVIWRIFAIALFLAISFAYLPRISERLARVEAAADVVTGKFAAAVLEADSELPVDIASAANPTRSRSVRVILSQSQNTYLLHSTECTVIGDLDPPSAEVNPRATELTDVCTVFAIPTARLKSIKYFRIGGKAPANESLVHPVEVGFGEEPFEEVFSSDHASDEEELRCPSDDESVPADDESVRFFNSLWYELKPLEDGTVFARVETLHFIPVIGIWEVPQEETIRLQNVAGSGEDPNIACEARVARVGQPTAKAVGILINVRAGTRYLAVVGSQQDVGGGGTVTFEFTSGASILTPGISEEELPTVTLPSAMGNAQLELRGLNRATYQLRAFSQLPEEPFLLVPEGGKPVPLGLAKTQDEEDRTLLDTQRTLDPGVWRLQVPALREGFVGQVKLTSVTFQPDLVIALAEDSAARLDARVQAALLAAIDEVAIRDNLDLEGRVVFDHESLGPAVLSLEPGGDDTTTARDLLEEAGATDGLSVQIQVEEGQEEERATLLGAAEILRQQLLGIGLDVTIEACKDVCIRVFFRSEAQDAS